MARAKGHSKTKPASIRCPRPWGALRLILACLVAFAARAPSSAADQALCPKGFQAVVPAPFGVRICAQDGTRARDTAHAAQVLRRILDFDQDGAADNQAVLAMLQARGATFVVARSEAGADAYFERSRAPERATLVFTGEMETSARRFDPTLEEALHLVTSQGYALVYPHIFGEAPGSAIAELMDQARGGQFRKVPRRYPKGAYFTYDDRTCDYACQVTEFSYWAITTLRGQQGQPGRARQIADEWRLATPEQLRRRAPQLAELLSRPEFALLP